MLPFAFYNLWFIQLWRVSLVRNQTIGPHCWPSNRVWCTVGVGCSDGQENEESNDEVAWAVVLGAHSLKFQNKQYPATRFNERTGAGVYPYTSGITRAWVLSEHGKTLTASVPRNCSQTVLSGKALCDDAGFGLGRCARSLDFFYCESCHREWHSEPGHYRHPGSPFPVRNIGVWASVFPPKLLYLLTPMDDVASVVTCCAFIVVETLIAAVGACLRRRKLFGKHSSPNALMTVTKLCWYKFAFVYLFVGICWHAAENEPDKRHATNLFLFSMPLATRLLRPALIGIYGACLDLMMLLTDRYGEHVTANKKKLYSRAIAFATLPINILWVIQAFAFVPIFVLTFIIFFLHGVVILLVLLASLLAVLPMMILTEAWSRETEDHEDRIYDRYYFLLKLLTPTTCVLMSGLMGSCQSLYFAGFNGNFSNLWERTLFSFFSNLDWSLVFTFPLVLPGFPPIAVDMPRLDFSWQDLSCMHDLTWLSLALLRAVQVIVEVLTRMCDTRHPLQDRPTSGAVTFGAGAERGAVTCSAGAESTPNSV
mmetsp:Transcript_48771/g.155950  ORF Transcript_48771/g.155950 Transcript_48771/m.155950 type:complete len:538 (-) Transcript_48771:169-1782(-)